MLTRDNNVSEMLMVKKSDTYRLCTIIAMMKKWRHFPQAAFSFSGWIGLLKSWQSENDGYGTHEKINAAWWNIKSNV